MKWLHLWSDCVVRVRTNCCILPSPFLLSALNGPFSCAELRPLAATACLANLPLKNTRQLAGTITDRARVDRGEPDDEAVEPTASPRHWVVYNMPPDTKSLPENAGKARLPQGALLGLNDFKKTGYGGPCPPIGRHRYFHKLYALDITLDLRDATKSQIERAMRGHVLANAELIGTYQKGDR